MSRAVLLCSTVSGLITVPLLPGFFLYKACFVPMIHPHRNLLPAGTCPLLRFPSHSQKHAAYSLYNWFLQALNSEYTLPNRLPLHFVLNPRAFYTQSYLSSTHDANYIPNVANLKPSVHSGPPCVSFWRQEQIFPRKFSNHLPGYTVITKKAKSK